MNEVEDKDQAFTPVILRDLTEVAEIDLDPQVTVGTRGTIVVGVLLEDNDEAFTPATLQDLTDVAEIDLDPQVTVGTRGTIVVGVLLEVMIPSTMHTPMIKQTRNTAIIARMQILNSSTAIPRRSASIVTTFTVLAHVGNILATGVNFSTHKPRTDTRAKIVCTARRRIKSKRTKGRVKQRSR